MSLGPRPARWSGGKEDFNILRQLDHQTGINVETDGDKAVDMEYRRRAMTPAESDLSGTDPEDCD
jgi:hypothetical protein